MPTTNQEEETEMDITQHDIAPSEKRVVHRSAAAPKFNAGRRAEIKYRDLGLEEATGGQLRAEMMQVRTGVSQPTGWHYHTAEVQFLHVFKGWVKMEFETPGVITLAPGDSITIPGGTVHQELTSSDDLELLEITLPAKLGTVNVPTPAWARTVAAEYGDRLSEVQKLGHASDGGA